MIKFNKHTQNKLDSLLKRINLLKKTIQTIEDELEDQILQNEQDVSKNDYSDNRNIKIRQNALATRYINTLLSMGIHKNEAVLVCASKMNLDPSFVFDMYSIDWTDNNYIEKRAKYLCVEMMHKKGYTAKKIAEIFGFSEKYVFKILKKIVKN